ncbi:hypothetical protein BLAT2472_70127 [Burkholderia latens]
MRTPAPRALLPNRHDQRTRPAEAVHDRRRRHGRFPAACAIQAAGCDHEPVADPEGGPEGRIQADPRENRPRSSQRKHRFHHRPPADRVRHRDPEADPGPRVDRSRRAPVVRHAALDRQGPRTHQVVRSGRRRPRAHPDQARIDVGRHPRGRGAAKGRDQVQHDPAFLARAGRRMRGSRRAADLAVRRPHLRLVQEAGRRRLGRSEERRRERSGRAVGAPHLHVLQDVRLQDRSDGRELPHDQPDYRARRLRPADDQPGPAAEAARQQRNGRAQAVPGRAARQADRARRDRRGVVPLPAERRSDGDGKTCRRHSRVRRRRGKAREAHRRAALNRAHVTAVGRSVSKPDNSRQLHDETAANDVFAAVLFFIPSSSARTTIHVTSAAAASRRALSGQSPQYPSRRRPAGPVHRRQRCKSNRI